MDPGADVDDALDDEGVTSAPPVVVVMVVHDSGPWLEEALGALATQDYPNLSVLLLDNASAADPTPRVAAVMPSAYVRRLTTNAGYAPACNEVLQVVEGASHYLFCHDDVAPDPDAIRLMVEEAFRSNAGIVSPKLVAWTDPRRLLQVGMTADKTGAVIDLVEAGELDQEQHDGVRDVFVAPGACMLVRADLFASLGGFDAEIPYAGEDVDLSWRAQVAGARVVVAPAARVRHAEAIRRGERMLPGATAESGLAELQALAARHSLMTMLKTYGPWHLLRVMPQAIVTAVVRAIAAIVTGRRAFAGAQWRAWRWNLGRLRTLRGQRRQVRSMRRLGDAEVRRLQSRGSAGLISFARGHHLVDDESNDLRMIETARTALARLRPDGPTLAIVLMTLLALAGTRGLLGGPLPITGELARFPDSATSLVRQFVTTWNSSGMGSETPHPPALGLLGVAGFLLLGAMGLLQRVVLLGTIPLGLIGAHRLARPLGSRWAGAVAAAVYAAIPVPWNALSEGRWSGVVVWAAMPWIVLRLARASGLPPFGDSRGRLTLAEIVPLAAIVAVGAALAPSLIVAVILAAIGLTLGLGLSGLGSSRVLRLAAVAVLGAIVLLAPWSVQHVLALPPAPDVATIGALLRFETGSVGSPPLGWMFLIAALLPLVLGRDWRARWATGLWAMALVCWLGAWCASRGWLPLPAPHLEPLLAPAALALALSAALGVRAFEVDLPDYHFGWRQLLCGACMVAAVLGALPSVVAATDGRWHLTKLGAADELSWMEGRAADGPFRVLWLGRASSLPMHGWRLGPRLAYATSDSGPPDATELWSPSPAGATEVVGQAVLSTEAGRVSAMGQLLAPFAVRYIVVMRGDAPPVKLVRALAGQSDLKRIQTESGVIVYENSRWMPLTAQVPGGVPAGDGRLPAAIVADLGKTRRPLDRNSSVRYTGAVEEGSVLLSATSSPRWQLSVDGRQVPRRETIGSLNGWQIEQPGRAVVRHRASPLLVAVLVAQLLAWGLLGIWLTRAALARRRERLAAEELGT